MGCCTELHLARRGMAVMLFDREAEPFSAASRWNEGKIHLGFLYSADPSMRTAAHVLPGSLNFRPQVEELLDGPIDAAVSAGDDIYLRHRASVVSAKAMEAYFHRVAEMVRDHPDAGRYLTDVSGCAGRRLTPGELAAVSASPEVDTGFSVPERSVSTIWIADRLAAAVAAEARIELRTGAKVVGARPQDAGEIDGRWRVLTQDGDEGPFDAVFNTLWEGRLAVDASAGVAPSPVSSNRYRLSLFVRTSEPVEAPCAIVATGPFGDIKNYNGRDFYLSRYPDGLRIDSSALTPPLPAPPDAAGEQALGRSILDHLEAMLPDVGRIRARIEHMALRGGWVFAAGRGALSDPRSGLHRRSDFGVERLGSYVSVDTGKYATVSWLARRLAEDIC
jgi:glycine/D-amino acid oxidase-like deaminating enzyme